jgi:predicted ArsR family transcriptional regulator
MLCDTIATMSTDQARPALSADEAITTLAVLADQLRRRMFDFIRTARRPVTREEAAAAVGISRKLAAFHLDKLVTAGLLRSDDAPVRGTRQVGRTPKAYLPAPVDVRISLPERRPDLLASILIDAVLTAQPEETPEQAVFRTARSRGAAAGATDREQLRSGRLGAERALTVSAKLLTELGYQPDRVSPTRICLRNCPFHPLAAQSPDLVCGLNHAYLAGFLDGLAAPAVEAALEPREGECCVELRAVSDG